MPRYFDLLNGVVEDFFPAALGLDYHAFIRQGVGLGYASVSCDFLRPTVMGAQVVVTVLIARVGGASVTLLLHMHQSDDEILRSRFAMVTTSMATSRSIPLPTPLRSAMETYQDQCR